jgi:hypothetical protein
MERQDCAICAGIASAKLVRGVRCEWKMNSERLRPSIFLIGRPPLKTLPHHRLVLLRQTSGDPFAFHSPLLSWKSATENTALAFSVCANIL